MPKKHNHIEIIFDNIKLIYNDPRRFGYFEIIENYIYFFFKNKSKNIKNFLLDQNFVSGIGNIYASEILFLCEIKPTKKVSSLHKIEYKKIAYNSRKVLSEAINFGGSSIRDFKNISGEKGSFQKNFKVYQREGRKCKRHKCKGIILRKIISNRSTFFCNSCQK